MKRIQQADLDKIKQQVTDILALAKDHGASHAEVAANIDHGLTVGVRKQAVETVEFNQDKGVGVTVYFGKRKGTASTTDTSPDALKATVQAACEIAKVTQEDPCSGLPDESKMAVNPPDLDLYHPWDLEAHEAIELAIECERAGFEAGDDLITNSDGANVASYQVGRVYGNSHGFVNGYTTSRHSMSCSLIAGTGDQMQRDYHYTLARDASELKSPSVVGQVAADKAIKRLNGKQIKTCQTPVIFHSELAGSLFSHMFGAISGGAIYRQSSFLLNKVGEQIFPSWLTLTEKPHIKKALGSAPFDSEGVTTYEKPWIENGVLKSYVLNSYSARQLGLQTTGNAGGLHNIRLQTGDKDLAALMKQMGKGLLVTEMMGRGVNKVTGDYSRGAFGYWVENGEIQFPVEEITIAGNLKDMFMGIQEIGCDLETRGNIHTGSILIDSMAVAGA